MPIKLLYACFHEKKSCFFSKIKIFLKFSCVLNEIKSRNKFSRQRVTNYLKTFLRSTLASFHHKCKRARLLSPETECTTYIISCSTTSQPAPYRCSNVSCNVISKCCIYIVSKLQMGISVTLIYNVVATSQKCCKLMQKQHNCNTLQLRYNLRERFCCK